MEKLIITCAVTGSLTLPTQTPYLPITPEQIAAEAYTSYEAGASSVHVHARDPRDGRPSSDIKLFEKIINNIREKSNIIICVTTGGSPTMSVDERIAPVRLLNPELATLNMGPVCASLRPLTKRYADSDYKYGWEKPYLTSVDGCIMENSFKNLDLFIRHMNETGTKPECECWDISHVYNAAYYFKQGLIKSPIWLQFVTGPLGAIGSDYSDILHLRNTAERLFGANNYRWSLIATGTGIFNVAPLVMMLGGNIRVGFEDNIYVEKGVLAKSNAEMISRIVKIAKDVGREVATPDEARAILNLK